MNKASIHSSPAPRVPELPPLPPVPLAQRRVLVMSDRLPMGDRAHGGLAAALNPVLRERRGVWIGWPGVSEEEAPDPQVLAGAIQSVEELAPGCAFRLRRREVHIVENVANDVELAVLGVFTPAGSPSAADLTEDVAATYAISG